MKFQDILPEIIKGRGFQRKNWEKFVRMGDTDFNSVRIHLSKETLNSDDWELEPISKLISLEDLRKVWDEDVAPSYNQLFSLSGQGSHAFKLLAEKLGLK